ncbi:TetR/AcrR family transcriptional regulator [Dictyobacter kobayashii]|uniref:HTH tetR-type domain-containing protein n=1 Tax=Dictyobacter kobayashii TaxID=2014872 RepID=A0A402AR57_9CHLR|nr:TetR/AcrR family transcriptional regulator [Dictyobacter kobayashii]GCE21581.1 hypothetical protein KDK_53810 [Dictyobacter kobayashii]
MGSKVEDGARAKAKREQILTGARHVFLREGFAATSTDELAREARVSKRTLYAYYPSKEELFADVLRELTIEHPQLRMLDFVQRIEPHSAEELHRALAELAKRIVSVMLRPEYLALLRMIIADSHRIPQLTDIFRATIPERGFKEVNAMLQRAQENGIVVRGDREVMTRSFIGPLLTYALMDGLFRPEGQSQPPTNEKIEEIVDLYMKAISSGNENSPTA